MTNRNNNKDFEQPDATGTDCSQNMQGRGQGTIHNAGLCSLVLIGLGAFSAGVAIAVVTIAAVVGVSL